jgi:transcriptional regulator with XRE-family HTH domain
MAEPARKKTDKYDSRTIGLRLRLVRLNRGRTLEAIAGLVGISEAHLSSIEHGERAIDSRKLLHALANALHVAPSDLTRLPVPAPVPANGDTDSAIEAIRRALMAATAGRPGTAGRHGGEVQSVEQLRHRCQAAVDGDFANRAAVLPRLIADMHTTLAQRREMAELLPLAVLLHGSPTWSFLYVAGAPIDLRWLQIMVVRPLAEELGDPVMLGFVANRAVNVMIGSGAFKLARGALDAITVPTATNEGRTVNGMLALHRSLVAAVERRPAEVAAALEHAAELATHTSGDAFAMGFSPVNVDLWHMAATLEYGEPDETIQVAKTVNPNEHPHPERQATYWMDYGRALTSVRRRDDAARALLTAERLHPTRVLRNPFTRESIAELVTHAKDDALGRDIRGMARRAHLPV